MEIGISRIGTALPPHRRTQQEVADFLSDRLNLTPRDQRRLKAVYQASGIETRYSVIPDYLDKEADFIFFPKNKGESFPSTAQRMTIYKQNALPLAIQAIEDARLCQEDKFDLQTLTHLITVSCTAMYAPGLDIELILHYALPTHIHRLGINFMGCYGTFNAIKTAYAICAANPKAKVLIVSLELCSIHLQSSQTLDHLISGAIFSDGAGAIIIESNIKQKKYLSCLHFHSDLLPNGYKEMTWDIGDQGFDIRLSSYVPDLIGSAISKFLKEFLDNYFLKDKKIDKYAIHPGGIKILEACEKALNIQPQDNQPAYEVLKKYGNMSSATIVFVLKELWKTLKSEDHHQTIFSCAFGPGLTLESMLLRANHD